MLVVIVLYIHQMICTRNFKGLNERIETGVLVKSQKRKNVSAERTVGERCQWEATGQFSRETPVVSATEGIVGRKHNRPLLLQKRRRRLTQENPGRKSHWMNRPQRCKNYLEGT